MNVWFADHRDEYRQAVRRRMHEFGVRERAYRHRVDWVYFGTSADLRHAIDSVEGPLVALVYINIGGVTGEGITIAEELTTRYRIGGRCLDVVVYGSPSERVLAVEHGIAYLDLADDTGGAGIHLLNECIVAARRVAMQRLRLGQHSATPATSKALRFWAERLKTITDDYSHSEADFRSKAEEALRVAVALAGDASSLATAVSHGVLSATNPVELTARIDDRGLWDEETRRVLLDALGPILTDTNWETFEDKTRGLHEFRRWVHANDEHMKVLWDLYPIDAIVVENIQPLTTHHVQQRLEQIADDCEALTDYCWTLTRLLKTVDDVAAYRRLTTVMAHACHDWRHPDWFQEYFGFAQPSEDATREALLREELGVDHPALYERVATVNVPKPSIDRMVTDGADSYERNCGGECPHPLVWFTKEGRSLGERGWVVDDPQKYLRQTCPALAAAPSGDWTMPETWKGVIADWRSIAEGIQRFCNDVVVESWSVACSRYQIQGGRVGHTLDVVVNTRPPTEESFQPFDFHLPGGLQGDLKELLSGWCQCHVESARRDGRAWLSCWPGASEKEAVDRSREGAYSILRLCIPHHNLQRTSS